jgi:hypothetical protein
MRTFTVLLAAVAVWVGLIAPVPAEPVDTGRLLDALTDLQALSRVAEPRFETVQFSSYDRRSDLPGGEHWFANSDGFGGEPVPNFEAVLRAPGADGVGEYLLCDLQGPGAIVRTWTARINGSLRVTLDGGDTPLYDGPAESFLLRPYDTFLAGSGVESAALDHTLYQRNAAYAPISFAKGCRIVWTGKLAELHFYAVQARIYAAGTAVTSFTPGDLQTHGEKLRQAIRVLAEPDAEWRFTSKEAVQRVDAQAGPGERHDLWRLDGAGLIERLSLRLDARDRDRALRQTLLRIYFDGHAEPQVEAPLGDFFGAAPGINPYVSVPFTVAPDGTMTCRFPMPFAQSARVEIENRGDQLVMVAGTLLPARTPWDPETSMHFRARWRVDHDLTGSPARVIDMPYLVARGAGTFIGAALYVLNPNDVPSPGGNWWGEGDEKIFVNDEARPGTFGTGSEDYFNYAWSSPDIFVHPFCGQPRNDGPANRGFVTNFRWQVLDPLPFRKGLAFFMELFPHEPTPGMAYARIAYHYGRPGLMDDHVAISDADLRAQALPATWTPAARGAAANSVFFPMEERARTKAESAYVEGGQWEGGRLYVWTPMREGEELLLGVPVREAGRYVLHFCLAHMPDSGRFSLRLDGEDIGFASPENPMDLNDPHRTLSRCHGTRELELAEGIREITLRYEGGGARIGMDFLQLQRR